jgi:DNA invertase Pin-like site-specific DNA recombinase
MLSVFAEFESALRRERQLEGIAKAKAEGRYKMGRPRKPEIQKRAQDLRPTKERLIPPNRSDPRRSSGSGGRTVRFAGWRPAACSS